MRFPRILGIEAAGVVEEAPGGHFQRGDVVATVMGGMGRQFDGGYAEFTCPPASQVKAVRTKLPWETLGAIPEMLQTAHGSLVRALRVQRGERLPDLRGDDLRRVGRRGDRQGEGCGGRRHDPQGGSGGDAPGERRG